MQIRPIYFVVDDYDCADNVQAIREVDAKAQVAKKLRPYIDEKYMEGPALNHLMAAVAPAEQFDDDPNTRIFVARHPYELKGLLEALVTKAKEKLKIPMIFFTDGSMPADKVYEDSPATISKAKPFDNQIGTYKVLDACKELGKHLRVLVSDYVHRTAATDFGKLDPEKDSSVQLSKSLEKQGVKNLLTYLERFMKAKTAKK